MNRRPLSKLEFDSKDLLQRTKLVLKLGKVIYSETCGHITVEIHTINNFFAAVLFSVYHQKIMEVRSVSWMAESPNRDALASLYSFGKN